MPGQCSHQVTVESPEAQKPACQLTWNLLRILILRRVVRPGSTSSSRLGCPGSAQRGFACGGDWPACASASGSQGWLQAGRCRACI